MKKESQVCLRSLAFLWLMQRVSCLLLKTAKEHGAPFVPSQYLTKKLRINLSLLVRTKKILYLDPCTMRPVKYQFFFTDFQILLWEARTLGQVDVFQHEIRTRLV